MAHFRSYVFGRRFKLHKDVSALQWVERLKESVLPTRISQYNMEVIYKLGEKDVLTRSAVPLMINAIGGGQRWMVGGCATDLTRMDARGGRRMWRTRSWDGEQSLEEESPTEDRSANVEGREEIINDHHMMATWSEQRLDLSGASYMSETQQFGTN